MDARRRATLVRLQATARVGFANLVGAVIVFLYQTYVASAETARFDGFDAGIGVSCGVVVAGNVGAEERYEYTVIGDPVNEAARLTELAKQQPARVLASASAVRTAGGEEPSYWLPAGTFELRGRSEPTVAYAPS